MGNSVLNNCIISLAVKVWGIANVPSNKNGKIV